MTKPAKSQRCAIYTRVSTDAGLDQDFNSLDAQREAAEAYIKSQAHEGWKLLSTGYDDGGFSGGSLDRPALRQLLEDIKAGSIDIVLVYKVDRLTRSLADFAKLVELFDAHNVSFVSVTQAFNTTNSMGRLTLNVLLSFAQFEREVTAERIRDKICASKRNGIWMGGTVPMGYRVVDRKLLVDEKEAQTVRMIFERYLELGSSVVLLGELRQKGVTTRTRQLSTGRTIGGTPFTIGALTYMLRNRTYVGEIQYKDQIYQGEHAPILDRVLFDAVQAKLTENRVAGQYVGPSRALLQGKIQDDRGNVMSPSYSQRGPRRYHFYVSRAFIEGRRNEVGSIHRVSAQDIEPRIVSALRPLAPGSTSEVSDGGSHMERSLIETFVQRVTIVQDCIRVELNCAKAIDGSSILNIPWKRKKGRPRREVLAAPDSSAEAKPIKSEPRKLVIRAIAQGRSWLNELVSGGASVEEIAKREDRSARSITMSLSLAFLAPEIVEAAISGRLPRGMGILKLCELPPLWVDQKAAIFAATAN